MAEAMPDLAPDLPSNRWGMDPAGSAMLTLRAKTYVSVMKDTRHPGRPQKRGGGR